ncbi:MAG: alpha-L-arabinofuranosidase C-terminal domain-containing protein [Pirellulales bacterium]
MKSAAIGAVSLAVALLFATIASAERVIINVDAAQAGPRISPTLYGIFLEEISHGVDGGLYAEKIRNRAFEDGRAPEGHVLQNGVWTDGTGRRGFPSGYQHPEARFDHADFGYIYEGLPFWSLIKEGGANGSMNLEKTGGITEQSSYCMRLEAESVGDGRVGVANTGFFGIGVKEGEKYNLSLYVRGGDGFRGPLKVRLEDNAGAAISDEVTVDGIGGEWKQFKGALTVSTTNAQSRLAITTGSAGRFWLDFVSLFPADTWKGRANGLRPDIAQMIADLKPKFVRFPGGCNVDSCTIESAYNWKLSVGPVEQRSERWGAWDFRRTYGMGLFESLQFCEDMGAEPLWVGFAGQTCIHRNREHVPMEEMGWVRDGFLDIVEYANGPADSKWGAMRAAAGHPQPFDLKYIEIGNENSGAEYLERYNFIHSALKAKYPNLTYLGDLSFTSDASMRGAEIDIIDRHYYQAPRIFISRHNEYDRRDRNLPPLYLGEVAVTTTDDDPQRLRGNLQAALAEGVFLLGCERNSDTVKMVSYAPLIGHVAGRTALTGAPPAWHAMIYFDGNRVFGTVSYYLWKLFGHNRPDQIVPTKLEFDSAQPPKIVGQIGLGTWASTAEYKDIRVERNGEVLYASDFSGGTAEGWQPARGGRGRGRGRGTRGGERGQGAPRGEGPWSVVDGAYRQGTSGQSFSYFGDENWSDYTLSLKARKLSGNEGFLIVFGRKGDDRYWWNLGGWGNRQHGIEQNQIVVGRQADGTIENDRWYDIKIELAGNRIRAYLDGQLLHDVTAVPQGKFFVVSGREDTSGDIVVKAINITAEAQPATIKLSGVPRVLPDATLTVLTAASPAANNNLDNPTRVAPVESRITIAGPEFAHEFPPNSFSVLRLKTK